MTTLACRIHGALDLRLEPETPPALGPHDVRLRLGAGGICGSDLHYYQHGRVGAFVVREPLVPGHEASGVVDAIGSERHARGARRPRRDQPVARLRPLRLLPRRARQPVPQACSSSAAPACSRTRRACSAKPS